jgi:hypothetical protein
MNHELKIYLNIAFFDHTALWNVGIVVLIKDDLVTIWSMLKSFNWFFVVFF